MRIDNIMTRDVVTVGMDDRLGPVRQLLQDRRIHHVLVVEEDRLLGVVSDRDILFALSPRLGTMAETPSDAASPNKRIHQIMTRNPVTLSPEEDVLQAIEILLEQGISCIPITSGTRPVGILTWRDCLRLTRALMTGAQVP